MTDTEIECMRAIYAAAEQHANGRVHDALAVRCYRFADIFAAQANGWAHREYRACFGEVDR